jgi:hypothetical protein
VVRTNTPRIGFALLLVCAALPARADDGFSRNNVIHFDGHGSGVCTRDGATERLSTVNVDIDRGGKVLVSFRTEKGHSPLTFSGSLIESNQTTLKAAVASDDSARLRGSMSLSRNAKGAILHISLEATNGQEHLHLDWNHR